MSRLSVLFVLLVMLGCSGSKQKPAASASDDDSSQFKSWDSDKDEDEAEGDEAEEASSSSDAAPVRREKHGYISEKKLPPGPSCLNQQGNVQECMSDDDCCKNFYCGYDPEGNTRQKVCLYGGK